MTDGDSESAHYAAAATQLPAENLTVEQVQEIELRLCLDASVRVMILHTLTMTGAELVDIATSSDGAALATAELSVGAEDLAYKLRGLAGLLERAQRRLELSLCSRTDMPSLLAQARATLLEGYGQVGHG